MQTHIVSNARPLPIDRVLLDRLGHLAVCTMPVPPAAAAIRVGVEGPEGELYRIIETTSVVEAVRVFEVLKELGLRPEAHRRRHGHKVTRVYRPGS